MNWLRQHPDSVLRKTVLQEVGIAAVAGAYAEPALVAPSGTPIDVTIQRNCRYEAWFLGGVYVICVVAMGRRLGYSWRDVRGLAIVPAFFGLLIPAGGWLLYNMLIFGNPLNFANGPDSSAAQMAERHSDINVGSWPMTLKAYGLAVGSDLGLAVLAVAVIGLGVFLVAERFSARSLPVLGQVVLAPGGAHERAHPHGHGGQRARRLRRHRPHHLRRHQGVRAQSVGGRA